MKQLLVIFLCVLGARVANAQLPCVAAFTSTSAPAGNSLLRVRLTNSGTLPAAFQRAEYTFSNPVIGSYGVSQGGYVLVDFPSPGTYPVNMTMNLRDSVSNALICTSSVTQNVTVSYPACGAVVNYTVGASGAINFTATNPAGATGLTYNWNFGDGTTGVGSSPSHTYTSMGTFNVVLIVTAAAPNNCSYTNTTAVTINNLPGTCSGNTALFIHSITNNNVVFTNTSPASALSTMRRRADWDFGDGSYGSGNSVLHTYGATGTYTVTMVSFWVDSISSAYCSDTVTNTVSITSYVAGVDIHGNIRCDATSVGNIFKVWLIADTAANLLAAVDSVIAGSGSISGTSWVVPYSFTGVMAGNYRVKAALIGGSPGSAGPVPTYADSSLYWNAASVLATTNSNIYNNVDIWMRTGTITSGPGFIGGNISFGANKGTNSGVSNVPVYLRKSNGNGLVKVSYTDINGDFTFTDLPVGNYTVYPEAINYATTDAVAFITTADTSVTAVNFNMDDAQRTIKPSTTIIIDPKHATDFSIYPNPARDKVVVKWEHANDKTANLVIIDVTGTLVFTRTITLTGNTEQTVDVSKLPAGGYLFQFSDSQGRVVKKLTLQH